MDLWMGPLNHSKGFVLHILTATEINKLCMKEIVLGGKKVNLSCPITFYCCLLI